MENYNVLLLNRPSDLSPKEPDDHSIPLHQWLPPTPPSAVIHISHGMGEYAQRYASLSSYLNNAGFIVYAHDHRGHGMNIDKGIKGHFSHKNGWNLAVDDTTHVLEHIRDEHRELPCFLLGHSMGSYLIQSHLIKNNLSKNAPKFQGMILSGSNYAPQLLMWFARVIAKIETLRQGKIGHSKLIDLLTFSDFNRSFKPQRTDFDWLSRDHQQVNAYVNDPLCGFPCTNQLWLDLFTGLQSICSVKTLEQLPRDLPVLIMGGADDPVSAPKGQQKLAAAYEQAGVKEVTTHIYPQGRHEMFNEINREQVIERLIQWMNNHLTE